MPAPVVSRDPLERRRALHRGSLAVRRWTARRGGLEAAPDLRGWRQVPAVLPAMAGAADPPRAGGTPVEGPTERPFGCRAQASEFVAAAVAVCPDRVRLMRVPALGDAVAAHRRDRQPPPGLESAVLPVAERSVSVQIEQGAAR
jgi:hypothetical protein